MTDKEKEELISKFNFSDELMGKLEHSIDILRKAEPMALDFYEKGFYLCFSGGKDSQALYHVAVLAGVKFEANMNMTTVDPPEVVRFVRQHYPNVVRHIPEINFYDLIVKKEISTICYTKILLCCFERRWRSRDSLTYRC